MNVDSYQLTSGLERLNFEFVSEGPKGRISKRIQFTLISPKQVYNLAFGDKDPVTGAIDDTVVSNNGDSEKVLATVVRAVFAFFNRYPDAWIFATGSTIARTRLYQIGITKYFGEVNDELELYGQIGNHWLTFEKNRKYLAFLVRRKTS